MKDEDRALQLYSVLGLAALTRTVLTYGDVAALTGLPKQSGSYLGHIYCYCKQRGLPLLSALVVNSNTGLPGHTSSGIYKNDDVFAEQRRCFAFDWLNQSAPTPEELAEANARGVSAEKEEISSLVT